MGLLGLFGIASDTDAAKLEAEFGELLVPGEELERGFKLVRDLVVFTTHRIILLDKQGMTGKKREYRSVPYRSVVQFTKATAGHFDVDAEIKVWLLGIAEPLVLEFRKDEQVHDVYRLLARHVLPPS